jgi:hypothetical protein
MKWNEFIRSFHLEKLKIQIPNFMFHKHVELWNDIPDPIFNKYLSSKRGIISFSLTWYMDHHLPLSRWDTIYDSNPQLLIDTEKFPLVLFGWCPPVEDEDPRGGPTSKKKKELPLMKATNVACLARHPSHRATRWHRCCTYKNLGRLNMKHRRKLSWPFGRWRLAHTRPTSHDSSP